jgi:hypothetical protein
MLTLVVDSQPWNHSRSVHYPEVLGSFRLLLFRKPLCIQFRDTAELTTFVLDRTLSHRYPQTSRLDDSTLISYFCSTLLNLVPYRAFVSDA